MDATKRKGKSKVVREEEITDVDAGIEAAKKTAQRPLIKNKMRREELFKEEKHLKAKAKRERREKRKKELEQQEKEGGDEDGEGEEGEEKKKKAKLVPKTLESTREFDETVVDPDDEEVMQDQAEDEFASYFAGRRPKICVTTSNKPVGETFKFAEELVNFVPDAEFFPRRGFNLKTIVDQAKKHEFTDVIVINEDKKKPNALLLIHLPDGPTAQFKLSSVKYPEDIPDHGRATTHYPEVIINNFHTRLGHQVGRLFASMFPQKPEFVGRSVVTFHNQRDFIFVRRHRYIFKGKEKVGLQELGPRFTLKLRWLQKGTFDKKEGEYEWLHKPSEMDTSRRKFFL